MPGDSGRSQRPSWRKSVETPGRKRAAEPGWRKESTSAAATGTGLSKRGKFTLLAGGVFVTFALVVWLILWIAMPREVGLVLVGARYDDDKAALPTNIHGWNGLQGFK